jgi:hypothetical protein
MSLAKHAKKQLFISYLHKKVYDSVYGDYTELYLQSIKTVCNYLKIKDNPHHFKWNSN